MNITGIKAFNDNYIWMINLPNCDRSYVVDPGDPAPVMEQLQLENRTLAGVLITHHHRDHTGGIDTLSKAYGCSIYGPKSEKIPNITDVVNESTGLNTPDLSMRVIEVPGHTLDHIAYYCPENRALFCGDTLFAGGCGRMFEGQPQQMHASLQKLATLPTDTRVYCAHEYTQANLKFAVAVEPNNSALNQRVVDVDNARANDIATVPSSIGIELDTNPFLRVDKAPVISRIQGNENNAELDDDALLFGALRRWKDNF